MPEHQTLLDSPALGTASNDLIEGCKNRETQPSEPDPVIEGRGFAVALSGGGFRATLTALGALRFLADVGLLGNVRYLSSVSGGSIANALVSTKWRELSEQDFLPAAYDHLVLKPFVDRISARSLTAELVRNVWRALGSGTRTDVLAKVLDDWFLNGKLLEDLPAGVRFVFNAANITTGVRFGFERDVLGDWVMGLVATKGTGVRVAQAVAASAAVPGAFAPMKIPLPFPCAEGRTAALLDGGAYDNLGLEVIDDLRDTCIISANAGGTFQTGRWGRFPIVSDLKRANSLLYRQTNVLRMRTMVERFIAWERARNAGDAPPSWGRQGVLFGLATTMDEKGAADWLEQHPEPGRVEIVDLALTPTSFGRFDRQLCERLIHRGWWLTGATLSSFHRNLLDDLPGWSPLP